MKMSSAEAKGRGSIGSNDIKDEKKVTRRDFFKLGGAFVAAGLSVSMFPGNALARAKKSLTGKRYGMVIDLRRCVGCMSCQVSCKMENDVPLGVFRSWVKIAQRGKYPDVKQQSFPRLCNHCDNPPCVSGCPTRASYRRDDGVVLIDYDKCIGCKYCIAACPYNARFVSPVRKVAEKCTFCAHRIDKGLDPTCVRSCMGRARTFGDISDPKSEVSKLITENSVRALKPEKGTEPSVFYIGLDRVMVGLQQETSIAEKVKEV